MKQPVRGGLKGGRRSVKRGQSVEFADYRDYALGDDLRQLDWNVYARLEKLFVKLFIEEEDVTITFLLDASPSMAFGKPQKLLFAKRAAAALGYIALAGEDRVVVAALAGRTARRQGGLRGSGRVFRLLAKLSGDPAGRRARRTSWRAARHAAAMLTGRGVIVLISDLLDPGADRVIRELAATGSELIVLHVLSPDELDPPLEGDLRLVDSESGEGSTSPSTSRRSTTTRRGSRRGRRAWRPRGQAPDVVRPPLLRHAAGRPRVRRAAATPGRRVGPRDAVPRAARARRPAFVPLVVAMYLLKLRRNEAVVPSTLLWQQAGRGRGGERAVAELRRSLLLLLQLLLVLLSPSSRPGRSWSGRPASPATSSSWSTRPRRMQATDVAPNRLEAAKGRPSTHCGTCRQAARSASSPPAGRHGSSQRTADLGRVQRLSRRSGRTATCGDMGEALPLASALAARPGDAQILVATDAAYAPPPRARSRRRSGSSGWAASQDNQAIVALAVRTAPTASRTRSSSRSPTWASSWSQRRLEV